MAPEDWNKEEANENTKEVGHGRQSSSMEVEIMQRTRYPRQCKKAFPVKVEERPVSMKASTRNTRKLTDRRKNMIRQFAQDFLQKPDMYDAYGTEGWIDALLKHMNERPAYGLAAVDVRTWMATECFFNDEMLNMLSSHQAPKDELPCQRGRETSNDPAVQPYPTQGDIVPIADLPNDSHPNNLDIQTEPEHRVKMEITSEANSLTVLPLEMAIKQTNEEHMDEPMEPMEFGFDFVPPLPPPRRGSYSDAFVFIRQLEDNATRALEILEDLKHCSPTSFDLELAYYVAVIMRRLVKNTYDRNGNGFTSQ